MWGVNEPHDLRAFFKSVGRYRAVRALTTEPQERPETTTPIEVLDEKPQAVIAEPFAADCFADGIQASLCVAWREQRPVYLFYVAAGAIGAAGVPFGVRETLTTVCSTADTEWVENLDSSIPITSLDVTSPPDIEGAAHRLLGQLRADHESALIKDLVDAGRRVVVDGSLMGRPRSNGIVGVVKTVRTKYMPDERSLFALPEGWRSARFKISHPTGDRWSAYVRMHDASREKWDFGLIRVEAWELDQIDEIAARALRERQSARSGDGRWDRHLSSVHTCEEYLRSLRPAPFGR